MTRIVGTLYDGSGPFEGRLHFKPSRPFLGSQKELSFRIEQGKVDIELAPTPRGAAWLVGWHEKFSVGKAEYHEQWVVPNVDEIDIDALRGFDQPRQKRQARTERVDAALWKAEAEALQSKLNSLEEDHAKLLRKLSEAEARAVAAQGQNASLSAELLQVKRNTAKTVPPIVEERIVEKRVRKDEHLREISELHQEMELLKQRNAELEQNAESMIATATHFTNLHAEIDRLNSEKQSLLLRIEELKSPIRRSSSLRNEAIANLDKLFGG